MLRVNVTLDGAECRVRCDVRLEVVVVIVVVVVGGFCGGGGGGWWWLVVVVVVVVVMMVGAVCKHLACATCPTSYTPSHAPTLLTCPIRPKFLASCKLS